MSEVVVVAVITVREGKRKEAETLIAESMVPDTHAESGCVTFALHRDTRDENRLVFVERWASAEALDQHAATDHMSSFREAIGPLTAQPSEVYVLDPVTGIGDATKATLAGG